MNEIEFVKFTFWEKLKCCYDLFYCKAYSKKYTFEEWKEDINF